MRESDADIRRDLLSSLRRLSDAELVARVKSLAARERRATALLVAHLAELDTRDVHLRAGYSSLFTYCRDVLSLSEHEAYNRIEVARAARRFPVILEMLAVGSVNLTTVRLLGPHLTPENHRDVLESARGKRKAEVEEMVARLSPRPAVPATVRKLPESRLEARPATDAAAAPLSTPGAVVERAPALAGRPPALGPCGGAGRISGPCEATGRPSEAPSSPSRRRSGEITPLSPDRYRLQLTISGATLERLRLAKDMLRHAIPSGDDEAVLDRALTVLLVDLARKKFAAAGRPPRSHGEVPGARPASPRSRPVAPGSRPAAPGSRRATPGSYPTASGSHTAPASRHVPAHVKRAVWLRDLGRCAFVGTNGRRCDERGFVEFHHVRPYAVGGESSVSNIQLRCRRHNDYEAREYFVHRRASGDDQKDWPRGTPTRERSAPPGVLAREHGAEWGSALREQPGSHGTVAREQAEGYGPASPTPFFMPASERGPQGGPLSSFHLHSFQN